MTHSERILDSWDLLRSYRRHRGQLLELSLRYYLELCRLNRGRHVITVGKYQETFAKYLERHPLFSMDIMRREKPHIPPYMYQTLSEHLVRYITEQHWNYIASHPC